ncbi:MAG: dihydropteroate synthase [Gemmataceae bacterium]|jgi:dihydropteroate synthase|nr:MAG: dihydropteroate synthase [Gemmataceae bacterium]
MERCLSWRLRDRTLHIGLRPLVMGIINVTPDSFSDGGLYSEPSAAIEHGLRLAAEGADILDIGGESTRPGAEPVPEDEELRRVLPVVTALARQVSVPLSIDTRKASVARHCLEAGASILNDVSGLRDAAMVAVAVNFQPGVIVMHMQGTPQTMHLNPHYDNVVLELRDYFQERFHTLAAAGLAPEALAFDPGIGFGKNLEHNLQLLAHLGQVMPAGRPVVLGVSRKGFLGQITGRGRSERLAASLAVGCIAAARGQVHILRVHDVAPTRDAMLMLEAIDRYRSPS